MLGKIESEILVTHPKWVYFFINPPYEPLYPLYGKCNFKFPYFFWTFPLCKCKQCNIWGKHRSDRKERIDRTDRTDSTVISDRRDRTDSTVQTWQIGQTRQDRYDSQEKHLNVSLTIYVGQFYSEKDFVNIKSESVLVLFQLLNIGSIGLEPLHALMFGRQDTWGARDL